jgi:DNA-binding MarR family transcriptional regulator
VARERAQDDRRGAFAVLTSAGRAMRKKMWPVYSAAIGELFEEHITERDAAQMKDTLRRIVDGLRQPGPET